MTAERAKAHIPSRDPSEFGSLIEPYRGELRLHCYRLLGSLHEAEDLVQETMLRAWQYADTFKGQATLRTWLYRIATNACLDVLKKRPPRALPAALTPAADPLLPLAPAWAESTWLEPFPDSWLAQATEDPAARFARRESFSLAFLVALQLLPPRQRAILLLSDVLDWHASEIASLLSISVSAVKSALHRARVTLSKQYHADEQEHGAGLRADAATQTLLERYLRAWESENIDELVALMKEDATFTMPPLPSWYRGREAIRAGFTAQIFAPLALLPHRGEWRPGLYRPSRCRPRWPVSGFGDSSRHAGSFRIRRTHRRGDVFSRSLVRDLLRLPTGTAQLNPKSDSASEQVP